MRPICVFILGLSLVVNSKQVDEKVKQVIDSQDVKFHNVLKKVASVNKELKDLVENYKELKKIYESNKIKESKRDEDEVDKLCKEWNAKQKINRNREKSIKNENTKKSESHQMHIRMFERRGLPAKSFKKTILSNENIGNGTVVRASKKKTDETLKSHHNKKGKTKKDEIETSFEKLNEKQIKAVIHKNSERAKEGRLERRGIQNTARTGLKNVEQKQKEHLNNSSIKMPREQTLLIIANSSVLREAYDDLINRKEDTFINREQFKTDILRSAYSDACVKVVIKKCFKATQRVLKRVCKQFTCKTNFKSRYKTYEKRGCIKFYDGDKNITASENGRSDSYIANCYSIRKLRTQGLKIEDTQKNILKRNVSSGSTIDDANTNILRDRLEKACRDISISKCKQACKFAYTQACNVSPRCNKEKTRLFKKECKKQCEESFKDSASSKSVLKSDSSSDSTSSSGSSKSKSSAESGGGW